MAETGHWRRSPNFGPRRNGHSPHLIVLHYTAMKDAEAALDRLCDPTSQVSAHYLVHKTGRVTQMVREEDRAWHAGAGEWRGQDDVNSRSIGIELDNTGTEPFAEPLMRALEDLIRAIRDRWPVAADDIIGHSDMAPDRKYDPGPRFDWTRLARQGLAGPVECPPPAKDLRSAAHRAGFTAPVSEAELLAALRLRFAPWRRGPIRREDLSPFHDIRGAVGQTSY